jgi:uncharacterized protein (TIGR03067 family)
MSLLIVLVVGASPADTHKKEDLVKQEVEKLQGKWELISIEVNGQAMPQGYAAELTFQGRVMTVKTNNGKSGVIYTVDPTKKPQHFDTMGLRASLRGRLEY